MTKPTMCYLKRNEKYEEDSKQPFLKGFAKLSKEQLDVLLESEPDSYDQYKLDIAFWKSEDGVLKGNVNLPFKKKSDKKSSGLNQKTIDMPF